MLEALQDLLTRQWNDLLARPSGPMSFRFLLQPAMAICFAMRDGLKDARMGRSPYFWTILTDPVQRGDRLHAGFKATARVLVLGLVMDAIYQFLAFKAFYPLEAVIVSLGLAFVPYLLVRGPANRIAHWWNNRHPHPHLPSPRK